jgi:hypothetical protein
MMINDLKRAFASIGLVYKGCQFGQYEWRTQDGKRGITADWDGRKWCFCELNVISGAIIGSIPSVEQAERMFV